MKKLLLIAFIFIFMFCSSVSALTWTQLNDTIIQINQGGTKVATLYLLKNTDLCFQDCSAKMGINISSTALLPNITNSNFNTTWLQPAMANNVKGYTFLINKINATYYEVTINAQKKINYTKGIGYINNVDWNLKIAGLDIDAWQWFNSSWTKRQLLNLSLTNRAENGIQFPINVTYDADMKADFTDLRFTIENGTETEIPYWIERSLNSSWAYIWLSTNILLINTTHYMYYKNPVIETGSDPAKVFYCYDDFLGSSLNTTKWTAIRTPVYSVANSYLNWSDAGATTGIVCQTGSIDRITGNLAIRTQFLHPNNYDLRIGYTNVSNNVTRSANGEGYISSYSTYGSQHQQVEYDIRATNAMTGINTGSFRSNNGTIKWNSTFYMWNSTIGTISLNETKNGGITWNNISSIDVHINRTFYLNIDGHIDGQVTGNQQIDEVFMYKFPSGIISSTFGSETDMPYAPNKAILTSPTNNSKGTYLNMALWVIPTDNDTASLNVTFYDGNNTLLCFNSSIGNNSAVSCSFTGEQICYQKFWYVNVTDGIYTTKSDIWTFTTDCFPNVTYLSPDMITNTSYDPTEIGISVWDKDTAEYNVTFYDYPSMAVLCNNVSRSNNTATFCNWTTTCNTTYLWVANVTDGILTPDYDVWNFTTALCPLVSPILTFLQPNASNIGKDWAWLGCHVQDPDNEFINVSFWDANDTLLIMNESSNNTDVYFNWTGLNCESSYMWYATGDDGINVGVMDNDYFNTTIACFPTSNGTTGVSYPYSFIDEINNWVGDTFNTEWTKLLIVLSILMGIYITAIRLKS